MRSADRAPTEGPSTWRRGPIVAVAAVAFALAACGPAARPDSPAPGNTDPPWAAAAEDYVAALHEASGTGFTNVAQFYAEDVEVDWRGLLGYQGTGRAPFAQVLRDFLQPQGPGPDPRDRVEVTGDEPVYLSPEGAIDPQWVHAEGFPHWSHAMIWSISPEGIVAEQYAGAAFSAGYAGLDREQVDPLAFSYVQAWSTGDPSLIGSLYAEEATVTDSMGGLALAGGDEIGRAVAAGWSSGGLLGATLHQLPIVAGDGGDAYYISLAGGQLPEDLVGIVVLMDVTDERGCRRQVAAQLDLEGPRITREQRFHRVDSLRQCVEADLLPGGWWDSVAPPDPHAFTSSATTDVLAVPITLWNHTPRREHLLRWAIQQFADAGLPPPIPLSVTFVPFDRDPWDRYGFVPGSRDLILPDTWTGCPEAGCALWPAAAREAAIDVLARFWVMDSARREALKAFAARRGLAWTAGESEVDEPFADEAAQVVAWGLADPASTWSDPFGPGPACRARAAEFEALTVAPPRSACPGADPLAVPEGSAS